VAGDWLGNAAVKKPRGLIAGGKGQARAVIWVTREIVYARRILLAGRMLSRSYEKGAGARGSCGKSGCSERKGRSVFFGGLRQACAR